MRALAFVALFSALVSCARRDEVVIGSKKFTESVLLGEVTRLALRDAGVPAVHRRELGGSRVLFEALVRGDIDVYPEYTGTLRAELVPEASSSADAEVLLAKRGVVIGTMFGFADTYALAMLRTRAAAMGIKTISDLAGHPDLRYGLSDEFLLRDDGWPALKTGYALQPRNVRGMEHELTHRGLAAGALDVIDLYSTDAEVRRDSLLVLVDDRHVFPDYRALLLCRRDLFKRVAGAKDVIELLAGRISADQMSTMNARAKQEHVPETRIAADFLQLDSAPGESLLARVLARTQEHVMLVSLSLLAAIAFALPLGIFAARSPRLGRYILALVGVVQTIPSLALLVVMIPLVGIGVLPALAALFLYGLLPIVRNTYVGLRDLPPALIESADALGLSRWQRLRLVELPMASRSIVGGIKTAAVINVGAATLGALVGAGGYGQPILSGIRLASTPLILEGAVPAALLALLVEASFGVVERVLVPRGLR